MGILATPCSIHTLRVTQRWAGCLWQGLDAEGHLGGLLGENSRSSLKLNTVPGSSGINLLLVMPEWKKLIPAYPWQNFHSCHLERWMMWNKSSGRTCDQSCFSCRINPEEGPHAGGGCEQLQPLGRAQSVEIHEGFPPTGMMPHWSRGSTC